MMSFVIPSRGDAAGRQNVQTVTRSIRQIRGGDDEIIVVEGAPSMAAALNDGIRRASNERVCLTHDDVELRRGECWSDDVLDATFRRYPVGFLGAAGSKDAFPDGRWFIEGNRLSGAVFHGAFYGRDQQAPQGAKLLPDGRRYLELLTTYGDFGRVVLLDGVVLITTKSVIEKIGGFDEDTFSGWHHYDLDATLRAHELGLHNFTMPLFVRHMSGGVYDDKWAIERDKFISKWNARLPILLADGDENTIQALHTIGSV